MKVVLLILFVSAGSRNYGSVETLQYEMPDVAHCESVMENLNEIFTEDPALRNTEISMKCLEIPK